MPKGPVVVDPEQVEAAGAPGGCGETSRLSRLAVCFGRCHRAGRYGIVTACERFGCETSAGEHAADGPLGRAARDGLRLDARVERSGRRGEQAAQAASAATEVATPGRDCRTRGPAELDQADELCLLEEVLLMDGCEVWSEGVHLEVVSGEGGVRVDEGRAGSAGVIVAVRRPGVGSPVLGGNAEEDEDPDRQDDCDEGSHAAPPFSSVTPSGLFSGYLMYINLLRVT